MAIEERVLCVGEHIDDGHSETDHVDGSPGWGLERIHGDDPTLAE
jgi:hypothetical protein